MIMRRFLRGALLLCALTVFAVGCNGKEQKQEVQEVLGTMPPVAPNPDSPR